MHGSCELAQVRFELAGGLAHAKHGWCRGGSHNAWSYMVGEGERRQLLDFDKIDMGCSSSLLAVGSMQALGLPLGPAIVD